eukprot:m.51586 g.51586  ORF g.51586 m.51586 type:complete len:361 (+) comp11710_c0_seq2:194-1276(+)
MLLLLLLPVCFAFNLSSAWQSVQKATNKVFWGAEGLIDKAEEFLCRPGSHCACHVRRTQFPKDYLRDRITFKKNEIDTIKCRASGVIGQPTALSTVSEKLADYLSKPNPTAPLFLLLAGPPNTGKTHLDETLRELLFTSPSAEGIVSLSPYTYTTVEALLAPIQTITERARRCSRILISVDDALRFDAQSLNFIFTAIDALYNAPTTPLHVVVLLAETKWTFQLDSANNTSLSEMHAGLIKEATPGSAEEILLTKSTELVPFFPATRADFDAALQRDLLIESCRGKSTSLFYGLTWGPDVIDYLFEQLSKVRLHYTLADVPPLVAIQIFNLLDVYVAKEGENCAEKTLSLKIENSKLVIQ